MSSSNFDPNLIVKDHVTERMISTAFQDLKVCSGFFDFETLYKRVSQYVFSLYEIEPRDFFGSSHTPEFFLDFKSIDTNNI